MNASGAFTLLVTAFALWLTVHVVACVRIASRGARWRGVLALVVLPLAPYFEARARAAGSALLWCAAAIAYGVAYAATASHF